jgi:putative ABC transport system permease protein
MEYPKETPRWRRYLRFFRRDVQADIDDELRFHFEARIDELVAQGENAESARGRALAEFGDVGAVRRGLKCIGDRIAQRERRVEWLGGWTQDIWYALRSLRRAPSMTATIVVTLALGLGLNTAMFSLLNAVFLRPPAGVAHPEQLRRVWSELTFRSGRQFWSGYAYPQFQQATMALAGLGETALYRGPAEGKLGRGETASTAFISTATSNYFGLLGVRPALGRFFTAPEDRLGAGVNVAVVSHAFWQRSLGGDRAALGQSLLLDREAYVVIGVAPAGFTGVELQPTEVWIPVATTKGYGGSTPWWMDPNVNGFQILMRLADGSRDEAADARLTVALHRDDPKQTLIERGAVSRTGSIIAARGPGKRAQEVQIAVRLAGVSLIVLLIACANVVNLLLAKALRRRREIAVRLALGISRARLARLVLTESVLLALIAGLAATVAATWGGILLRRILLPDIHWTRSPIDWRVLAAAGIAAVVAGLIAGSVPALQSGATELTATLRAGVREGFLRRSRTRSFLVIAQTAFSLMLLVGAALFVRSLANVRALDLGFDADRLLFARIGFDSEDEARDALAPQRFAEVADRLRGAPGIENTALAAMTPMSGFSTRSYYPDVDTLLHRKPEGMFWAVSPEYFAAAGTRLIRGAGFPAGSGAGGSASLVVNEAMARALWPGEDPIGRCVRFEKPDAPCSSVVGVAATARWGAVIEESTPQFYLPLESLPVRFGSRRVLVVRANRADIASVTATVRAALRETFPDGTPRFQTMAAVLEPGYRPWRLGATLFSIFGVLAGVVAVMGVFSTVSYGVGQRTHEFGVRVALGAQLGDIVRHGLGEGLRAVALGVAAGIALALLTGRLVASLLYGVRPGDPVAIVVVAAGLLAAATAAALIPALRAGRVDPVAALRAE